LGTLRPGAKGNPTPRDKPARLSNTDCPYPTTALGDAGAIGGEPMAKKPNYRFERSERERQKAAKKAARLAAKQEKNEPQTDGETAPPPSEPSQD
jgi:hypothetical protein